MSCFIHRLKRSGAVWAVLLLAGRPALAQSPGYPFPYSGFSFGSPDQSFRNQPSSKYGGTLPQDRGSETSLRRLTNPLSSPQTFGPGNYSEGRSADMSPPNTGFKPRSDNRARIWLRVPVDAEVWFEGAKTTQTGALRYYFSPPLAPEQRYSYQLQTRWSKDGKFVERQQQIDVRAGDELRLDVGMAPAEKNSTTFEAEPRVRPQPGK